jgi:hypothetical protein
MIGREPPAAESERPGDASLKTWTTPEITCLAAQDADVAPASSEDGGALVS